MSMAPVLAIICVVSMFVVPQFFEDPLLTQVKAFVAGLAVASMLWSAENIIKRTQSS